MAVMQLAPLRDMMSIKEGVEFLRDTPYPVTGKQLAGRLARRKAAREHVGGDDYYYIADILEAHRDHADRLQSR